MRRARQELVEAFAAEIGAGEITATRARADRRGLSAAEHLAAALIADDLEAASGR